MDKIVIELRRGNINANLIDELAKYSKDAYVLNSTGGFEIVTLVISLCGFIVCVVEHPLIVKYLERKDIILVIKGLRINDNPKKIVKEILKNQKMYNEVLECYKNNNLEIEGSATGVLKFKMKLEELFKDEDD